MKDSEDWGFGFGMIFFAMIFVLLGCITLKLLADKESAQKIELTQKQK